MFLRPNRLKTLKNLVFEKLDHLLENDSNQKGQLDYLTTGISATITASASALENESSILEALIFLIDYLQEEQKINREYLSLLLKQTDIIQKSIAQSSNTPANSWLLNELSVSNKVEAVSAAQSEELSYSIQPPLKKMGSRMLDYQAYADLEIQLMSYLYSFLPARVALDIGANIGDVSATLLETGFEVFAFEPYGPVFDKLKARFGQQQEFHPFQIAVGSADGSMELYIAQDLSSNNAYNDHSLFSSLVKHSMPDDLQFQNSVPVTVRSLASLQASGEIPTRIGLVKIDAEGYDLEIMRGMGSQKYPVVVAEYWAPGLSFAKAPVYNRLHDLVKEMRSRAYRWHIVIHRDESNNDIGFYCNAQMSVYNSWGNVFFFQDHDIFSKAYSWCAANLPESLISKASFSNS